MHLIRLIIENRLDEFREEIFNKLQKLSDERLDEYKEDIASSIYPLHESSNIVKMGRIKRFRRRVRRDKNGKIVIQRNAQRSSMKGYRISGKTLKRITAVQRMKKAQSLKRTWRTKRRSKLQSSIIKRRASLRRRKSLGIK